MTSPFLVNRQVLLGGSVNLIFSSTTVSPLAVSFIARYCAMVWPSPSATDSMPLQAVVRFALQRTDIGKGLDITSADKRVQQYATMSFQLGDITYSQEHLLIDPHSTSARRYTRSDIIGILGIDLLWKMDLDLDLAHRKLNLYEPSKCPGREVYWSSQYNVVPLRRDAFGNFFFPMELDGRKLEAILTTNNSVSTLSTDVTRRVYGFDKNSSGIESVADSDGHTIAQYRAMK